MYVRDKKCQVSKWLQATGLGKIMTSISILVSKVIKSEANTHFRWLCKAYFLHYERDSFLQLIFSDYGAL